MRVTVFDRMDECTEAEVQRLLPLVSVQRREYALRYRHTQGRFCCLKSWLMLKDLLEDAGYNRLDSDGFQYNPNGKPYIDGAPHFSISHCKAGIAVAIDERQVGIDIEAIRHPDASLIARTMNEDEQRHIQNDRDFTRFWTQKEAVLKAQGTGIMSFEQLQNILPSWKHNLVTETVEHDNYIYTIAHE